MRIIGFSISSLMQTYKTEPQGHREPSYTPKDGSGVPHDTVREAMGL